MDLMLEALKQIDGQPSVPPVTVILPLCDPPQEDCSDRKDTKRAGGRTKPKKQRGPAVEHFTFPELPDAEADSPTPEAAMVNWPACDVTETVYACAEAARNILRHLSLDRPRMVLFTSPDDGDGKTGLLLTLAPELAKRTTGSVLVVDANFRKPDLTALLHVPVDGTSAQTALIYPTNLPRLSFLPAPAAERVRCGGGCDAEPVAAGRSASQITARMRGKAASKGGSRSAQALQSRKFDPSTNEDLREGWSLVLVDTPSLAHSEVAPMVQRCDGVYLVVRLGYTARRAVAEAAHVIRANGGRLLGCIAVG